jgi:DNA-binding SARP family transcriptional activator
VTTALCADAVTAGIETEYADALIRVHNLTLPRGSDVRRSWPVDISILALGRFEVTIRDKPLAFTRKIQHRPLALLKALVAFGPEPVKEEVLMDLLWPDSEGDSARFALTTTLYRLRRLLTIDDAVKRLGGVLFLNSNICRVDVFELRALLDELDRSPEGDGNRAQKIEALVGRHLGPLFGTSKSEAWESHAWERLRARLTHHLRR